LHEDGQSRLEPYRARLIEFLKDRPEGFVQDGKLKLGVKHMCHIPDLQGDRFYPYL
jgi:hypothetical protein